MFNMKEGLQLFRMLLTQYLFNPQYFSTILKYTERAIFWLENLLLGRSRGRSVFVSLKGGEKREKIPRVN